MSKQEDPLPGKKLLDDSKNKVKKQKETEMKNIKSNSTVRTIVTVIITLVTVAAFIGTFLAGMNYQKSQDEHVKSEAINLTKQMASKPQK